MQATVTRTVAAPVDTVWAVLSEHEGMRSWAPGMTAELAKEGTGDRNGVGAVRRLRPAPVLPTIVEEITTFEPGSRLGYRALAGVPAKNYRGEVVLHPDGAGTRIEWTLTADQRIPVLEALALRGVASVLIGALVRAVRSAGS